MKKLIGSAFTIGVFLLVATSATAAPPVKQNFQETRKELKEGNMRQAKQDILCTGVTARISKRIEHYQKKKENHVRRYTATKERITALIDKLEKEGRDGTAVKNDLVLLDTKIQKLATDYDAFIAKLQDSKNFDCADSQGAFIQALDSARELRKTVVADAHDIQEFYKTTLKPDIRGLRTQKTTPTP